MSPATLPNPLHGLMAMDASSIALAGATAYAEAYHGGQHR